MAIIDDPTAYFQTKLYTGSAGVQSITFDGNSNLQPDWIWIKERGAVGGHVVTDTVRGISASSAPFLQPSSTGAEIDANGTTANRTLTSSNTNGFTLGEDAYYTNFNNNSDTYVSWNWKAGGTAVSNTDGSITSSVSANQDAGFSIVSYTGTGANATVGHGLNQALDMIIVKNRTTAGNWPVFHKTQGGTKVQWLNLTNATATESGWWNNTDPTSSVFSIGTQNDLNKSSDNIIAYCFAEKQGYSKFGSYTGNGSTDGTFVYLGFKPAFIIFKRSSGTGNWQLLDNKRIGFNVDNYTLYPNSTLADQDENDADILSNGFKLRGSGTDGNGSGSTYIYMAFASSPFTTSSGVPTTAR